MNQSHTEMAARLRKLANWIDQSLWMSHEMSSAPKLIHEAAAALESPTPPERVIDKSELKRLVSLVFGDEFQIVRTLERVQGVRCGYCDDTGDVHSIDGEWRGRCTCPAGQYAPTAPAQASEGAAAWMHIDDPRRVISALQKEGLIKDGGASASSVSGYSIPLVHMHEAAALRASSPSEPREQIEQVRALLWDDHPECCGSPQVGATYMGQQEMVCCGCPEPALLNDAQIVRSLRAMFPAIVTKESST